MPQFVVDPNNPGAIVANVATGGDVFGQKKKKKKKKKNDPTPVTTGGAASPAAPAAASGKTAAERRAEQRAAREEARRNRFNPLATPFKTPAQLREEAIRLAELGSPSEASLREEQAREEAGLTALTGALTGALGGVRTAQEAGLQGLGSLYQSIAGGAQQAGQSAAAAAGVGPSTTAAGATPVAVQAFPVLGAAIRGYESVAPVIGAQLLGGSRASLSKSLADRAARISSDTAKYLQQLQGLEYEKAVAQETARQNAARLGLSAEEMQFEQALAGEKLGLEREKVAQGWYRAETARQKANRTGNRNTDARNAKKDILGNLDKWTASDSGIGEFEISAADPTTPGGIVGPIKIQAADAESARERAKELYPDTFGQTTGAFNITYNGPAATAGRAPVSVWKPRVINYLMTVGGLTRAQANAFIKNRVAPAVGL